MNCIHLWVLPTDGKLIRGVCRKCGTMKLFNQSFGDLPHLHGPAHNKEHSDLVARLGLARGVIGG
jgi:hypothetical protein